MNFDLELGLQTKSNLHTFCLCLEFGVVIRCSNYLNLHKRRCYPTTWFHEMPCSNDLQENIKLYEVLNKMTCVWLLAGHSVTSKTCWIVQLVSQKRMTKVFLTVRVRVNGSAPEASRLYRSNVSLLMHSGWST